VVARDKTKQSVFDGQVQFNEILRHNRRQVIQIAVILFGHLLNIESLVGEINEIPAIAQEYHLGPRALGNKVTVLFDLIFSTARGSKVLIRAEP
jgi:hypothetical protein